VSAALILLAVAALLATGPGIVSRRAGLRSRRARRRPTAVPAEDPLAMASALDVLAVCLAAGMPVSAAAAATAPSAPGQLRLVLGRAAERLALGADPDSAWTAEADDLNCESLMRLARRSASSGSALADGVARIAEQCRQDAAHAATAAAERAGVLIAGPLGLCYLPAFVCLGIVPVVAGLAGEIFRVAPL
jgi:pilus assembly protein TadC